MPFGVGGISITYCFFLMAFQNDSIFWLEVEKIVPNPYQPRREFDQSRLEELADSIKMYGVLQPLTVTRKEIQSDNGAFYTQYELIAGERRLRASKLAGVSLVPVIIREGDQSEQEKLELAIIENLQREDLNAVDRALAFKQLSEAFSLSHTQVAKKVGRSREYVSNSIRLLALPEAILDGLRTGDIAEGHARTLLMLGDKPEEQYTLYREVVLKKMSVRELERIARSIAIDKVRKKDKNFDPDLIAIEKRFTETLGTRVQIQKTEFGGKLTIDYFSDDDLQYLLQSIKKDIQSVDKKPFQTPGLVHEQIAEVESLEEAPLSALIAQLQQAEISKLGVQNHNSPDSVVNTVSEPVKDDEVENEVEDIEKNDELVTIADTEEVKNSTTYSSSGYEYTDKVQDSKKEPVIVAVFRDKTTAVYVGRINPTVPDAPVQALVDKEISEDVSDEEGDLYSIRNFNV